MQCQAIKDIIMSAAERKTSGISNMEHMMMASSTEKWRRCWMWHSFTCHKACQRSYNTEICFVGHTKMTILDKTQHTTWMWLEWWEPEYPCADMDRRYAYIGLVAIVYRQSLCQEQMAHGGIDMPHPVTQQTPHERMSATHWKLPAQRVLAESAGLTELTFYVPHNKTGHSRDVLPSQSLGIVLKN